MLSQQEQNQAQLQRLKTELDQIQTEKLNQLEAQIHDKVADRVQYESASSWVKSKSYINEKVS